MEELKAILMAHAKKYPLMHPTDAVKLIYQNEFGGGHLIRDEQACLNFLYREYKQLGKDFIRCAAEHTGSTERFLQKPDILRQLTAAGHFRFGMIELEYYLSEYIQSGCSTVSHSEQYRQNYRPAYRIVLASFSTEAVL